MRLPSGTSSSRPSRAAKTLQPAKPMKFVPPTRSAKGTAAKGVQPSAPKVAVQPKKGEAALKK